MESKAYLVAIFEQHTDDSLTLADVGIFSEYPLTQMFGPRCNVQMLAGESYGATYDEAARNLESYLMQSPTMEWARERVLTERRRREASLGGRIFAGRSSRSTRTVRAKP